MAEGDLGAIIDSLEFDPVNGMEPRIIHISGSVFAIVYRGPDDDGYLITLTIDGSGTIGAIIDTYEFDGGYCSAPFIMNISGTTYTIAYRHDSVGGLARIITITIANNGTITHSIIDSLTLPLGYGHHMVNVSGDIYAIVYCGTDSDGYVCTVSIDAAGNIGGAVIDSYEYNTSNGQNPFIVHVSGTVFAVAHYATPPYGRIRTFYIAANGTITHALLDDEIMSGLDSWLLNVAGSVFISMYAYGANPDPFIRTVRIATNGILTGVDQWQWDNTVNTRGFQVVHVSHDVYLISHWRFVIPTTYGYLRSINVSKAGVITKSWIDSLLFDSGGGTPYSNSLIHVTGDIYAIAYQGPDLDGWLKTFDCETITAPKVRTDPATEIT